MVAALNTPDNPFVGPHALESNIYGRDREIRRLIELIVSERIVLLHSPSGAGKTSLIQAALISRLVEEGFEVKGPMRVGSEPTLGVDTSRPGFNRYVFSALQSLEKELPEGQPPVPLQELAGLRFHDYLSRLEGLRVESLLARLSERRREWLVLSEEERAELLKLDDELLEERWGMPADLIAELHASDEESLLAHVKKNRKPLALIFDQFEEILTIDPDTEQAKAEKEEFFEQVGEALRSRDRWALFSMREDYVPSLEPYLRSIPTKLRTSFRLDLLGKEAALEAIQSTAGESGVRFSDEEGDRAADKLVENLRKTKVQKSDGGVEDKPGLHIEPSQLQVVCLRLWNKLPWDDIKVEKVKVGTNKERSCKLVREEHIKGLEDVDDALGAYYAETVQRVAVQSGVGERKIRDWFEQHLVTGQGIRNQVLLVGNESGGLDKEVIGELVNAYLVRSEERRGGTWYELAHDRLIGPVQANNREWIEANLSLLQRQAALWVERDKPEGLLLLGDELKQAEAWAKGHQDEMTRNEREFLDKCRAAQKEIDDQKRDVSRFRKYFAAAAVLGCIALAAAGIALGLNVRANNLKAEADTAREKAVDAGNEAKEQARKAQKDRQDAVAAQLSAQESQRLAMEAAEEAKKQQAFAATKAAEAERARAELSAQNVELREQTKIADQAVKKAAEINIKLEQEKQAAIKATNEAKENFNLATDNLKRAQLERLQGGFPRDFNQSMSMSSSAEANLSGGDKASIDAGVEDALASMSTLLEAYKTYDERSNAYKERWNEAPTIDKSLPRDDDAFKRSLKVLHKALPASLMTVSSKLTIGNPTAVAFNGNDCVMTISDRGEFTPVAVRPGVQCKLPKTSRRETEHLTLGNKVLRGPMRIFDPARRFSAEAGQTSSVAASADGLHLAVGKDNGKLEVIDLTGPEGVVRELPRHQHGVEALALSDDGLLLATSTNLFSFKVTDVLGNKGKALWKRPRLFSWLSVLLSTGRNRLLTTLAFSHFRFKTPENPKKAKDEVFLLASADQYGCTFIRDALNGKKLLTIPEQKQCSDDGAGKGGQTSYNDDYNIWALAFSPDNKTLAISRGRGVVEVWALPASLNISGAPEQARLLYTIDSKVGGHTDAVLGLAYGKDGKLLATSSQDRTVRVWDTSVLAAGTGRGPAAPDAPLLVAFASHRGFVNDVAFNKEGTLLATAGSDDTIKVWRLDLLPRLKLLQTRLGELDWAQNGLKQPGNTFYTTGDSRRLAEQLLTEIYGFTNRKPPDKGQPKPDAGQPKP